MPAYPDLLSDDSIQATAARSGTTISAKTKSKSAKSKRKNEATAEQAKQETAAQDITNEETMEPLHPPSPPFAASKAPSNGITSPILEAVGDRIASGGVGLGLSRPDRTYAYPGPIPPNPGSPHSVPTEEIRGGFSNQSPPTSPHPPHRLPSRRYSAGYHLSTSPRGRPTSVPTHHPQKHQPQFYRPPDTGAMPSRSRSRKGVYDREYVALDTIQSEDMTTTGDACLLIGAHGSLHVYKVEIDGIQLLGDLRGLRGRVIAAKILPSAEREDQLRALRPLVVVIVHGPARMQDLSCSQHSEFDPSESVIGELHNTVEPSQQQYQTSVEVYSLREGKHISTLFECPRIGLEVPLGEHWPCSPPPSGALSIQAKGRFIVIASAISGEVYIFEAAKLDTGQSFRCIGKTWTSLPSKRGRTWSSPSATTDVEINESSGTLSDIPIFSVSHRWLAITPPVPSSKSTLHGIVDPALLYSRPPGIASHTSSSQPQVTCELDTPLEESRLNKVTRDVTQEVLKGARWVGDQGMQAWKNYWNKSADQTVPYEQTTPLPQFPPTHAGEESTRTIQHPALVSILDLERLSESQDAKPETALQPCATFPLFDGCSYLSFNPSGLQILTASTKGDVNFVWDLMRMVHGTSDTQSNRIGPLVRQVARFSRVTPSNIVDVAWIEPGGDKLAILTDRGTVHIHDLPPTAFQWPAPKSKRPPHARVMSSDAANPNSAGGWGAAFNAVSGGAQPILAAVRGNPLPAFSNFNLAAAGTGAGVRGGKLVANGFSKSVGAATDTVNSLRHIGENRLHLSSHHLGQGFVRWLTGRETVILVIGEASLQVHGILANSDVKGKKNRRSVVGLRMAEFDLPKTPLDINAPPTHGYVLDGHWPALVQRQRVEKLDAQPISHAEIETCAPYQTFHTDRHIRVCVYANADHYLEEHSESWVFGEDMSTIKIASKSVESDESPLDLEAPQIPIESHGMVDEFEAAPPILTTTRKKKGKKIARDEVIPAKDDSAGSRSVVVDWAADKV